MAALLFGGAGSLDYWQAWLFLFVYFAASVAITVYLIRHDPALLALCLRPSRVQDHLQLGLRLHWR